MRLDKQVFICDYCKKRVVRNQDDTDSNTKTLNVFEVEQASNNIDIEEFCSEECMINRLPELILKCKCIGASPNFTISNYEYNYEYEEENNQAVETWNGRPMRGE